ncbi:mobilization protein [Bacteroides heparinolyticus]|uniref:mobilization protein n=1 Tax=Prevotella heparinolytica TaxID=28113 RepID=UPI00359F716E
MKQSKKGACSSNTQTAKANCLAHNRRDENTERVPSYVNQNRSHLNRTIFEDDMIRGRKSIVPLVHDAEKLYTEKTGQKCQKSFAPFREACLHLKEGITDGQLMDFKAKVERETKWKVIGIWLHEDEGHQKSKYIEGQEGFAVNHHAHVLFSCQDQNTGKAIRADRTKLSHMQDLLAEATGMERGNKASETGRRHRTAMEQRIYSQEQRVEELYERAKICRNWAEEADTTLKQIQRQNEEEEEERKRIKARQEEDLKAYNTKKAAKEAILSASEGIKGLFGQSSKDKTIKALREQINAKQKEIFDIKAGMVGLKAQQEEQKEQQKAALNETRREAVSKYNELVVKHNKVVERNKELREVIKNFQEIPIIERCLAIIRSFVFHICGRFDADDRRLLSFVMQGNEDAAKSLRRAAFNLGGTICQYQYGSRWDQAERELRNIANGVREEERQQRSRGLRR